MLVPAILYEEEIKRKLQSTWHQDKYKWVYVDGFADSWDIETNGWNYVQFVSVYNDTILGFIQYRVLRSSRRAGGLTIVGFENSPLFIKDVVQAIDDIFNVFHYHKLSFCAIPDNPASKIYDKYIELMGGTMCGIDKEHWMLQDGKYYDNKNYEILASNYRSLPQLKRKK